MSAAPPVSIVIRSMGRPQLAEALAAIAAQTHPAIEVVLVDASGGAHPRVAPHVAGLAAALDSLRERSNP